MALVRAERPRKPKCSPTDAERCPVFSPNWGIDSFAMESDPLVPGGQQKDEQVEELDPAGPCDQAARRGMGTELTSVSLPESLLCSLLWAGGHSGGSPMVWDGPQHIAKWGSVASFSGLA